MSFSQSLSPLSLLDLCSTTREIQQIHAYSIKTGAFHKNPSPITTKIIKSSCSSIHPSSLQPTAVNYALSLFNRAPESSAFLYNTLIRACTQTQRSQQALLLFYQMLHDSNLLSPDNFTFTFALKACAQLGSIEEGEQLHCFILKTGFASDLFVENCVIHMYARCGKMECAHKVFDKLSHGNVLSWNSVIDGFGKSNDIDSARRVFNQTPERNIVSWNSMICGYVQNLMSREALDLFLELQISGLRPDEITMVSIVSAVSDMGLLGLAITVHGYLMRNEFSLNGVLGSALINMYSKCGSIYTAFAIFLNIPNKNVGHWTSMICGFAAHGFAEASLQLFSHMLSSTVKPNYVTFIGVLSACSHRGLVEEGLKHFNIMRRVYGIKPVVQHYGCLVDLLGRSGHLEEAKLLIELMPMEPGVVIWGTLLSACRNHGNIEIAEMVAVKLVELEPNYGGCYVLMSNLYASFERWDDFSRMRRLMEEKGVEKVHGFSWIEVDGQVHEFVVGDKVHPQSREIYSMLEEIESKLSWEWYS